MFTFTLVTPERKLVVGEEIEEAFVPAYRGELNILPGHAPLMTILRAGVLKYRLKGQSTLNSVAVSSGYAQVNPNGLSVLAETAERPEELEVERFERSLRDSQKSLLTEIQTAESLEILQGKITRAQARKDAIGTKKA